MEQDDQLKFETVDVDCVWTRLPRAFYQLTPLVYRQHQTYCCLLGPNPREGIFGSGANVQEAIFDWSAHLSELLSTLPETPCKDQQGEKNAVSPQPACTLPLQKLRSFLDTADLDPYHSYLGEF